MFWKIWIMDIVKKIVFARLLKLSFGFGQVSPCTEHSGLFKLKDWCLGNYRSRCSIKPQTNEQSSFSDINLLGRACLIYSIRSSWTRWIRSSWTTVHPFFLDKVYSFFLDKVYSFFLDKVYPFFLDKVYSFYLN